jgi:hypothetical protein
MAHKIKKEDFLEDRFIQSTIASAYGKSDNKRFYIETDIKILTAEYVVESQKIVMYRGTDLDKAIEAYNKV